MEFPHEFTDEVEACVGNYKQIYKKLPFYAIVNDKTYIKLDDSSFPQMIPDSDDVSKKYLLHDQGSERIEVVNVKDLSDEEQSEVMRKTNSMGLPLVLSKSTKDLKKSLAYDISLPHETLIEKLENRNS